MKIPLKFKIKYLLFLFNSMYYNKPTTNQYTHSPIRTLSPQPNSRHHTQFQNIPNQYF
jgi:hypothetical protein